VGRQVTFGCEKYECEHKKKIGECSICRSHRVPHQLTDLVMFVLSVSSCRGSPSCAHTMAARWSPIRDTLQQGTSATTMETVSAPAPQWLTSMH